ncbi:MAG TPA: hypothetical protein VHJ34_05550 [Actinomycetota bacterium]|nr:hypothetical protein [Actinomycetota bacterium]
MSKDEDRKNVAQLDRQKVWETRDYFSTTASTIVRQLGFAGIALVWLFRRETEGGVGVLPPDLRFPSLLVVLALTFDLLHYVWGSAAWGLFGRHKERKIHGREQTEPFDAPTWMNYPTNLFFWGKIVLIVYAYVLIGAFVAETVM